MITHDTLLAAKAAQTPRAPGGPTSENWVPAINTAEAQQQ